MAKVYCAGQDVLIEAMSFNSPGKHDATGAFLPESRACARVFSNLGVTTHSIEAGKGSTPEERASSWKRGLVKLAQAKVDFAAAYHFSHGWPTGLQGPSLSLLADVLGSTSCELVVLEACLTAKEDEVVSLPFAEQLANLLFAQIGAKSRAHEVYTFGHTTAGHCSLNPFVHYYHPQAVEGQDGVPVIPDGLEFGHTRALWRTALEVSKEFRFLYPFGVMGAMDFVSELEVAHG